jgi:hypothetical protein
MDEAVPTAVHIAGKLSTHDTNKSNGTEMEQLLQKSKTEQYGNLHGRVSNDDKGGIKQDGSAMTGS